MTPIPPTPDPAELRDRVARLKKERRAVVLAHNYQPGEVQDAADFVGDSLELSRTAASTEADVIVFCGVHFMAETAAILSPDRIVLIPDPRAGCPMADMITADDMIRWRAQYPGRPAVCYVNTSAAVKAECDVCCTSANSVMVVESVPGREVLFAPDKNLAAWTAGQTSKTIIPWDGYCVVHNNIRAQDIRQQKKLHPEAEIWAHPECRPEVIALADWTLSTGGMVRRAHETEAREIIVATEATMIYRLTKENPGKAFFPAHELAFCANMRKITLAKLAAALETMTHRVVVPPEIAVRARVAIERMIRL
ncbi:MAG: quinolinate synthase NadA [Candidatus Aminicenantes bacterium]|nr:quinolinate synthase NadA [Candidatus Aminicenantes bacterium]